MSNLELNYKLYEEGSNTQITELILENSLDKIFRLDINVQVLNQYKLKSLDLTITPSINVFENITSSDIQITNQLPIAIGKSIDNTTGTVRISACALENFGRGLSISSSEVVFASITFSFNENIISSPNNYSSLDFTINVNETESILFYENNILTLVGLSNPINIIPGAITFKNSSIFDNLTPDDLNSLSGEEISEINADKFAELSNDAIGALSAEHISNISGAAISALDADKFLELSDDAISALSIVHIQNIPDSSFSVMTADNINKMSDDTISAISGNQIRNISSDTLLNLDVKKWERISPETKKGMDSIQKREVLKNPHTGKGSFSNFKDAYNELYEYDVTNSSEIRKRNRISKFLFEKNNSNNSEKRTLDFSKKISDSGLSTDFDSDEVNDKPTEITNTVYEISLLNNDENEEIEIIKAGKIQKTRARYAKAFRDNDYTNDELDNNKSTVATEFTDGDTIFIPDGKKLLIKGGKDDQLFLLLESYAYTDADNRYNLNVIEKANYTQYQKNSGVKSHIINSMVLDALESDDTVTFEMNDGYKTILTVGTITSNDVDSQLSGTAGDPYIWPMKSDVPVKLPSMTCSYRMFEQGNTYINALVDKATPEHQLRMQETVKHHNIKGFDIITDGYFYHKIFIHADGEEMLINLANLKQPAFKYDKEKGFFNICMRDDYFRCGEFNEKCQKWTISWKTPENKQVKTEVFYFENPHLENGINVIPASIQNAIGMLVDNYKPKLMTLPKLTTAKYSKLRKRLKTRRRIKHHVPIKERGEVWVW